MNGQLVDEIRIVPGRNTLLYKMLDGVTSVANGVWVNVRGYRLRTLQITGIIDASVEIREATTDIANKPPNTDDGSLLDQALISDCSKVWVSSATWIKIKVPTYTSGTIKAFLCVDRSTN